MLAFDILAIEPANFVENQYLGRFLRFVQHGERPMRQGARRKADEIRPYAVARLSAAASNQRVGRRKKCTAVPPPKMQV